MKIANLPTKPSDYVSFKMDWNDNLGKYNPEHFSALQKVRKAAYSFFFYPLQSALKFPVNYVVTGACHNKDELKCIKRGFEKIWFERTINPSTFSTRNRWKEQFPTRSSILRLRSAFSPKDFTVTTPDDVNLRGTIFHKSENPNAKTLLVCSGRSQVYQQGAFAWLLNLLKGSKMDFNVVMYNPRGYGDSTGEPSKDGFVVDAETIYQYIHQELGVEEENIDIYGFSLGGMTAVKLKAFHGDTGGKIIHDRSFADSYKQIYYSIAKYLGDNIITQFLATIATWACNLFGWNGSIIEDWKNIEDEKLIIAHENDPVIPFKAGLLAAIEDNKITSENTSAILLKAKPDMDHIIDHHFEPLSNYCDGSHKKCALGLVSDFLTDE